MNKVRRANEKGASGIDGYMTMEKGSEAGKTVFLQKECLPTYLREIKFLRKIQCVVARERDARQRER